jgi:hypothetical protein
MNPDRQQPFDLPKAGSWVSCSDPFYATYTKKDVAAYETYGEWINRMDTKPGHFEINSRVKVCSGYQDRGSPPAIALPIAPDVKVKSFNFQAPGCSSQSFGMNCNACLPNIFLPSYEGRE